MNDYCSITISASSASEADKIARSLVDAKLVAGTMIRDGKCHYRWDDNVTERQYWNIDAFSRLQKKDAIIQHVKQLHSDKCPIIAFTMIDGNDELIQWIDESIE